MALNLSGADKTFRRYAAVEGVNHPAIPPFFQHAPPPGDAIAPDVSSVFTAVAATDLLTTTGHGLVAGVPVRFTSTTALPAGLSAGTTYYVLASGLTANDFKVSTGLGGSVVDITSTGTGTHSWSRYLTAIEQAEVTAWLADRIDGNVVTANALLALAAWKAYWNNPLHKAWIVDDYYEKYWQHIYRSSDHADAAQAATPPSGSGGGVVTTFPPASPANVSPN